MLALAAQVERVTGNAAVFSGMSGWMDSALLESAGIPTVVLGPEGAGLRPGNDPGFLRLTSVRALAPAAQAPAAR